MALFKIFRGTEEQLRRVDYREGYGYFIPGTYNYGTHLGGKLFFDINGDRYQIDANAATGLYDNDGNFHPVDEFLQTSDVIEVINGGTGADDLTGIVLGHGEDAFTAVEIPNNAIVLGDTAEGVKSVAIGNNRVVVGDTTNGVKGVETTNNALLLGDSANGLKSRAIGAGEIVIGDGSLGVKGYETEGGKLLVGDSTNGVKNVGTTANAVLLGDATNGVKSKTIENGKIVVGDGTDGIAGREVTNNAVLIGDTTNGVKSVSINEGRLVAGDPTNGIREITGTGVLIAETANSPGYGTAPIKYGGTGATTAAAARQNLNVPSIDEVSSAIDTLRGEIEDAQSSIPEDTSETIAQLQTNVTTLQGNVSTLQTTTGDLQDDLDDLADEVDSATTVAYEVTLYADEWWNSDDEDYEFGYDLDLPAIKCGKAGNVPPLITWTSNQSEYNNIATAEATPGVGITFMTATEPTEDIDLIVIDHG